MRAVLFERYGADEGMRLGELPTPRPETDQVLVRVISASVNSWDWELLSGQFLARMEGPFRPRRKVLGADVAGVVEAVGPDVKRFRPGDAVIGELSGHGWGGFAEYVCKSEYAFTFKPGNISFDDAATLPQAGGLALQALRSHKLTRPGCSALIIGGGGGVGGFAIQLARMSHMVVTAVDSTEKFSFMRRMGADLVFDHKRQDVARRGESYDLVVDPVAYRSYLSHLRMLKPSGTFRAVGGAPKTLLQSGLAGPLFRPLTGKNVGLLIWRPKLDDVDEMASMFAQGSLHSVIDKTYSLDQTVDALKALGAGQITGKAVIRMDR